MEQLNQQREQFVSTLRRLLHDHDGIDNAVIDAQKEELQAISSRLEEAKGHCQWKLEEASQKATKQHRLSTKAYRQECRAILDKHKSHYHQSKAALGEQHQAAMKEQAHTAKLRPARSFKPRRTRAAALAQSLWPHKNQFASIRIRSRVFQAKTSNCRAVFSHWKMTFKRCKTAIGASALPGMMPKKRPRGTFLLAQGENAPLDQQRKAGVQDGLRKQEMIDDLQRRLRVASNEFERLQATNKHLEGKVSDREATKEETERNLLLLPSQHGLLESANRIPSMSCMDNFAASTAHMRARRPARPSTTSLSPRMRQRMTLQVNSCLSKAHTTDLISNIKPAGRNRLY